jgi:hypothetical protein
MRYAAWKVSWLVVTWMVVITAVVAIASIMTSCDPDAGSSY